MKTYLATNARERACRVPIGAWQVVSSVANPDEPVESGAEVSLPGYSAQGWYVAPARSTVMAALLANGLYEGIERSRAMEEVDKTLFDVPWWYRATFTVKGGGRTAVRLDGVIHRADVWVNGQQVATAEETAGAYSVGTFDVTDLVTSGLNAVGIEDLPGQPPRRALDQLGGLGAVAT